MSDTTLDPTPQQRHRQCGRGLFGPLVLIAVGVIFLLDQLHVASADYIFRYFWPAVFIFFGFEMLSWRPRGHRLFWGVIAIVIGAGLIASNLGFWYFDISVWWPLILIVAGIALLTRRATWGGSLSGAYYPYRYRRHRYAWEGQGTATPEPAIADPSPTTAGDTESLVDGVAVLGGYQRRITSQQFKGGRLTAFFGGVQMDLTRSEIAGDHASLDITAMFGGVELRVPTRWIIELHGQPFLGGYSDETRQDAPAPGAKRLILTGWAMFGGVVIKN